MMGTGFWARAHGGVTHFPVALVIASLVFDIAALVIRREGYLRDLRIAAFYALMLAALGACGAVLSGLFLTNWSTGGRGMLLDHHLFVWPAFGMTIGLAAWRLVIPKDATKVGYTVYLLLLLVTAVLMATAGYWGGEMLIGGG
jgi:uncharacterized membrane protein